MWCVGCKSWSECSSGDPGVFERGDDPCSVPGTEVGCSPTTAGGKLHIHDAGLC